MNILFYGYGNHARRIKKYLDEYIKIPKSYCYLNRNIKKIDNKDTFKSIKESLDVFNDFSCAFITSPNDYHLEHLKDCLKYRIPYIYIEKPAIGVEEYFRDPKLINYDLKFVQVGYQYNYSPPIKDLKNILENNSYGHLLKLDLFFGKGLSFKENFAEEWRSKQRKAIAETLGCHLLNICIFLLGENNISTIRTVIKKSGENGFHDTYHACGLTNKSEMFSLTASWGSPLEQTITAYFSDLVWKFDMQYIYKTFPRNCFNENGYFEKPPTKTELHNKIGIESSISSFIEKVLSKRNYQFEFNNSALTSELLLKNIY